MGWELIFVLDRYIFSTNKNFTSKMKNSLSYIISSAMNYEVHYVNNFGNYGWTDNMSDNMSQETNFYSNRFKRNETYNNKVRLGKSTTYANTVMTLRPIWSSDIPGNKQKSPTRSACNKTVRSNSKRTYCTVCPSITHLRCITSKNNKKTWSTTIYEWNCSFCIQSVLPSYKVRDIHTVDSSI